RLAADPPGIRSQPFPCCVDGLAGLCLRAETQGPDLPRFEHELVLPVGRFVGQATACQVDCFNLPERAGDYRSGALAGEQHHADLDVPADPAHAAEPDVVAPQPQPFDLPGYGTAGRCHAAHHEAGSVEPVGQLHGVSVAVALGGSDDAKLDVDVGPAFLGAGNGNLRSGRFVAQRMDVDADGPYGPKQGQGQLPAFHHLIFGGVVQQDRRGACRDKSVGGEGGQREFAAAALSGE
ncbi:MAG: hypothetical protein K0R37_2839, partial [Arthrobacter sp.]|nr:hypothetical protein [Arthrobacter sp.]